MSTSISKEPNLMEADLQHTHAQKLSKRKTPSPIYYFVATFFFVVALFSIILYFVLDKRIDILKSEEIEQVRNELKNIPQPTLPPVKAKEGNKFYYIWKEELFQYDIDKEENLLVSTQVDGFSDIAYPPQMLALNEDYTVLFTYSDDLLADVNLFDLTSDDILQKIEIPTGELANYFDYDPAKKVLFQYIVEDGLYTFNIETSERAKIIELPGYSDRAIAEPQSTDEIAVLLSPNKEKVLIQDNTTGNTDPEGEIADLPDRLDVEIYDFKGNLLDSFDGTFAHWLDNDKVVYYSFRENEPAIKIRTISSKKDVRIFKELKNIVSIDTNISTSEILISTQEVEENKVGNYIFENTTGVERELNSQLFAPQFYKTSYIVGQTTEDCGGRTCSDEMDLYFWPIGLGIYNVKSGESKTIIEN